MIRRPPRSTLSLHDALPISFERSRDRSRQRLVALRTRVTDEDLFHRSGVPGARILGRIRRSEEHTSELQSLAYLVCRLLLEKKKTTILILMPETRDSVIVLV